MKKNMTSRFDFHSIDNFDSLVHVSSRWSQTYNLILGSKHLDEWEQTTVEQLILSEKVFDV